jgi:hypothetical protein
MTGDSGVKRMSIATNTTDSAVRMNHSKITPESISFTLSNWHGLMVDRVAVR